MIAQAFRGLHAFAHVAYRVPDCKCFGICRRLLAGSDFGRVISGQRPRDDRLGVAHEKPRFFTRAKQVFDSRYLQRVVSWRHADEPDGIAESSCIGVLVARPFQARAPS